MGFNVAVTDDRFGSYEEERAVFDPHGIDLAVFNLAPGDPLPEALLAADGILCNMYPLTRAVIERFSRCRIIARYGTGYDNVDVAAARERGMLVTNVPDYAVDDVAEHALALLLATVRRIVPLDKSVRQGEWDRASRSGIVRIKGKTLGIIGFGRIGRAFREKASGLGFGEVLVHDPDVAEPVFRTSGVVRTGLDDLLIRSDFISIHLPHTGQTEYLIGACALSLMKPEAVIINTSRGKIVDQNALRGELVRRPSLRAGLDVFESEPVRPDDGLCGLDNVTMSPHLAYYSRESIVELKTRAAMNVREVLLGRPPLSPAG